MWEEFPRRHRSSPEAFGNLESFVATYWSSPPRAAHLPRLDESYPRLSGWSSEQERFASRSFHAPIGHTDAHSKLCLRYGILQICELTSIYLMITCTAWNVEDLLPFSRCRSFWIWPIWANTVHSGISRSVSARLYRALFPHTRWSVQCQDFWRFPT